MVEKICSYIKLNFWVHDFSKSTDIPIHTIFIRSHYYIIKKRFISNLFERRFTAQETKKRSNYIVSIILFLGTLSWWVVPFLICRTPFNFLCESCSMNGSISDQIVGKLSEDFDILKIPKNAFKKRKKIYLKCKKWS